LSLLKKLIKQVVALFGLGITTSSELRRLEAIAEQNLERDLRLCVAFKPQFSGLLLAQLGKSKSQLRQDLVALAANGFKRNGFYVEFGATNGVELSNTYMLEKEFQWKGILSEPGLIWHHDLQVNRTASHIDYRCVWSSSGEELKFQQTDDATFSTISKFSDSDSHVELRKRSKEYSVATVSLYDLLQAGDAPTIIDYLSIDTEGSEFEILEAFDWKSFSFNFISCEHNYSKSRESLFNLLSANGYHRVLTEYSEFDDWYVRDIKQFDEMLA
jgi:FkbM family methyltransferase